ncbi:hypothetical protein [Ornithinimicrobium faecis]|uniref:Lipoprotein n=1 Tax=Ornithinimicrobium faecis TaxID=2934158 RepID=A0ABY4YU66_9MICO|nr:MULTISPECIES: hypothetical protein [unclassified Ornithinimicrobium]USQ80302.1 hypothetical protein NF556_01165 [Ornithinimicrobium sp. HY1793]
MRSKRIVVGGLLVLLLSACGGAEAEVADDVETAADVETVGDVEAAAQAVIAYWQVHDELASDHEIDAREAFTAVTRGKALEQAIVTVQTTRDQGLVQSGETGVSVVDVSEVAAGEHYDVTVCLDFSEVLIDGASVDRSGFGGDLQQTTYVVQSTGGSAGQLMVTEDPVEFEPCAG